MMEGRGRVARGAVVAAKFTFAVHRSSFIVHRLKGIDSMCRLVMLQVEFPSMLARIGMKIADACERFFPDAFVFALGAIVLVFAGGLSIGVAPSKLAMEFGNGFWSLVSFTMQMAIVIIG